MLRVGLFGGTFDPVHNGHISIARSFLDSGLIDELWVLLTPFPPHKSDQKHTSYELRYKMLKEGLAGMERCKILTIENELPKPSYTSKTIEFLRRKHPETIFFYCLGQDNLVQFHTWKHHKEILEQVELIVAHRPGESHDDVNEYILKRTRFVDHKPVQVSSSDIRKKIKRGENVSDMLPDAVFSIIEKEQLYR